MNFCVQSKNYERLFRDAFSHSCEFHEGLFMRKFKPCQLSGLTFISNCQIKSESLHVSFLRALCGEAFRMVAAS